MKLKATPKSTREDPSAIPALAAARRRRWQWVGLLLGGLIVALAASRPLYHWSKGWRSRSLAGEAEKLLDGKLWEEAASKAQVALQLAPEEPAALRASARLCTLGKLPAACDYWKALLATGAATSVDRREAARAALLFQRLGFAREQIAVLLRSGPASPETLELAGQLAVQTGDQPAALEYAKRLLEVRPGDPAATLAKAQLLFNSATPSERAEGQGILRELGRTPGSNALPALLALSAKEPLSSVEAVSTAEAIEARPEATPEHRLAALTLRLRAQPERRTALIEEAVPRFRDGGPEALAAFGRWLRQQGEPARVVELIPRAEALARQDLFLVLIDALGALGRWEEIQQMLALEKLPIDPFLKSIFLARAATALHADRVAETHWNNALAAARQKPELLLYLAQYADEIGEVAIAEKAWRQLVRQPAFASRANLGLARLLERQGRTRELREAVRELSSLAPDNPAPRNDVAYLDLLLGENLEAARQTAERLVREAPQVLAYRTTLALACLRDRLPALAQQAYAGVEIPWEKLPPSTQAVFLATLAANDELERAKKLAPSVRRAALKPEERTLIAGLEP